MLLEGDAAIMELQGSSEWRMPGTFVRECREVQARKWQLVLRTARMQLLCKGGDQFQERRELLVRWLQERRGKCTCKGAGGRVWPLGRE